MYRPAVVLGKIKDTNLQMECALVYGKVIFTCFKLEYGGYVIIMHIFLYFYNP